MNGRNPETERSLVQDSQGNLEKFRKPLLQYLISGLEHPDTEVRSTAADALGALADTETLGDLLPLMVSQDPQLREAALRSAEKIQNSRIDFYHCRTAGCEHCLIRSIAEEALARMRIRDCGISVMQKGGIG